MLAETADAAFTRKDWLFELKLDGYRVLAARARRRAAAPHPERQRLRAPSFPRSSARSPRFPFDRLLLDGEVVALDDAGRPAFSGSRDAPGCSRPIDIRRAAVDTPVTFYAFDLLGFEDFDLRPLPLSRRGRRCCGGSCRRSARCGTWSTSRRRARRSIGRRSGSGSRESSRRSAARPTRRAALRRGSRSGRATPATSWWWGSPRPRGRAAASGRCTSPTTSTATLIYAGRAGSGFTDKQLGRGAANTGGSQARRDPPCGGPLPAEKGTTWVEPVLVCEVEFSEWTDEGLLRQPVFLRFRDDKRPEECVRREVDAAARSSRRRASERGILPASPEPADKILAVAWLSRDDDEPPFELTNPKKVFWPEEGYTKGDLIDYYRAVSPWLLPYLRNRPLVMTRYPDGIDGKSFFQKDAPGFAPDWIRTERMWSEDTQREIDYFVCDDEASLLYVVNLGTIPLHIWASRVPTLERPDWCVLDLDPKGAPFEHVVEVARAAKELCDRIGLPVLVKTTGSSGLHLHDPAGPAMHPRAVALARRAAGALPRRAGCRRSRPSSGRCRQREGKVYVDYLQNGSGKLIVAPFSVRPLPGAPVSVPLDLARGESQAGHPAAHHQHGAGADAKAGDRSAGRGAGAVAGSRGGAGAVDGGAAVVTSPIDGRWI